jgi:hypothetical protein
MIRYDRLGHAKSFIGYFFQGMKPSNQQKFMVVIKEYKSLESNKLMEVRS